MVSQRRTSPVGGHPGPSSLRKGERDSSGTFEPSRDRYGIWPHSPSSTGSGMEVRRCLKPTRSFAEATRAVDSTVVVHQSSLPYLPIELKDSFDAVLTMHVMEHASSLAEARAWVKALAECLRPGGSLVVVAPDVRDYRAGFWDSDWSHGWPTTPGRIAQLVEVIGLEVTTAEVMRLGSLSPWSSLSMLLSGLIPTRPVNFSNLATHGSSSRHRNQKLLCWGE